MSAFNGFLGQLADGVLSPKGNLGDYAHASRLFVTENQKLAPHQKFLYHCFFQMDPAAASILPDLKQKHELEIGMLVKSKTVERTIEKSHAKTSEIHVIKNRILKGLENQLISQFFCL